MSTRKKQLVEKAFAHAYVASGMNGTQALQAVKPHLQPDSARSGAAELLALPSVQSQVEALGANVAEQFRVTLCKAIALADSWISSQELELQDKGMTWCKDLAKSFAMQAKAPPLHKHLHIPK